MREKSFRAARRAWCFRERRQALKPIERWASALDRKSTRLNSSHSQISYAVFCLKKKKKHTAEHPAILTPDKANAYPDRNLRQRDQARTRHVGKVRATPEHIRRQINTHLLRPQSH